MTLAQHYLEDLRQQFESRKTVADAAIAQLSDDDLFRTIDPESNSVAIVMRHIAGNLRSRFTDFLTTDGEKPERGSSWRTLSIPRGQSEPFKGPRRA